MTALFERVCSTSALQSARHRSHIPLEKPRQERWNWVRLGRCRSMTSGEGEAEDGGEADEEEDEAADDDDDADDAAESALPHLISAFSTASLSWSRSSSSCEGGLRCLALAFAMAPAEEEVMGSISVQWSMRRSLRAAQCTERLEVTMCSS